MHMTTLIIGGAGMIGRKLAERLAVDGAALHLTDVVEPPAIGSARVSVCPNRAPPRG